MNKNISSFMLSSHWCAIRYEHYNLQIVSNPGMFHYSSIIYEVMQVGTSLCDLLSFDTLQSQKTYFI